MEKTIEDKIRYAKIQLMSKSVFLSTICLRLKHKITDIVPTAGTDGLTILYNPEFIEKIDTQELTGLMAHEIWHVAYQHFSRLQGRDRVLWNVAGDYVINYMLIKAGFTLPKGGLYDEQYAEMTTEQVYELIYDKAEDYSDFEPDLLEGASTEANGKTTTLDANTLKEKVTSIVVQAQTQSMMADKSQGEIPGEISRLIDELINPKLDWKQLLVRYLTDRAKTDYTWSRPNKRFMPDHYLPSLYSETIGNITIAIDTSGSITDSELQEILTEIESIRDTYHPKELTIIDCDHRINNIHQIDDYTEILSLEFSGGGGTDFQPVINYCNENPPALLIYFTDLYADDITDPVEYDVLWVCNSNHDAPTIGETIYING
jgi:predicted metal-dependent peptidase